MVGGRAAGLCMEMGRRKKDIRVSGNQSYGKSEFRCIGWKPNTASKSVV